MVFFFAAFSVHWWNPGDQTTRAVVGSVIMVALVTILYGIIRAKCGGDRWWRPLVLPLARIGVEVSTYLADAMKQVMVLIGMKKEKVHIVQDPPSDADGMVLAPPSAPECRFQTNLEANISGRITSHPTTPPDLLRPDDREYHPNSSTPPTRSSQPTTAVNSPPQPHDDILALSPSDPHTSPCDLPDVGSLQQIQDIQLVFQSTAEVRYEPDAAPLGVPGFACTEGREVVNYTANVAEEPEGLEHPQPSSS